jgi:hypothetical protein
LDEEWVGAVFWGLALFCGDTEPGWSFLLYAIIVSSIVLVNDDFNVSVAS